MNSDRPPLLLLPALSQVRHDPGWGDLLARAERLADRPRGALAALAGDLGLDPSAPPIAALEAERGARPAPFEHYLRADPAYLRADAIGARLFAYGADLLGPPAIERLAEAVAPILGGQGLELVQVGPAGLLLRFADEPPTDLMPPPEQALGMNLAACLPQQRRWRRIFNALQIELVHLQPPEVRRGIGGVDVNAFWLWGAGPRPVGLSRVERVYSADADLLLLAVAAGATVDAAPGRLSRGGVQDWRHRWRERRPPLPAWSDTLTVRLDSGEGFLLRPWHRLRLWRLGSLRGDD